MSSSSSAKKVRKAARTGNSGGPKISSDRSLGFPVAIVVICVLGLALVVVSKADRDSDSTEPEVAAAEFAATYGIFDCTAYVTTSLPDSGAGAEFTIPLTSEEADRNGRLDRWGDEVGLDLSADALVAENLDPPLDRSAGDDCEGEEGSIFLTVWSSNDVDGSALDAVEVQTITDDPGAYRPRVDDVIAIVFAPEGTEVEQPPAPPATSDAEGESTESSESDTSVTDTSATGSSDPEAGGSDASGSTPTSVADTAEAATE